MHTDFAFHRRCLFVCFFQVSVVCLSECYSVLLCPRIVTAQLDIVSVQCEAKIRGVNSVSGEKLHDFTIICPARGVRSHPSAPLHPLAWPAVID